MMAAPSLKVLLANSINYAGMFPPCSLALGRTLQNQADLCARPIDVERLQYRPKFVASFGSCSFDEPREDLRALGLL